MVPDSYFLTGARLCLRMNLLVGQGRALSVTSSTSQPPNDRPLAYREVGRRFGVDWRTVKARIERAKQRQETMRWEAVSRDVYAALLREHLSLLVHVAFGVLSGVRTEPLFARQDQDPEVLLERLPESTGPNADPSCNYPIRSSMLPMFSN